MVNNSNLTDNLIKIIIHEYQDAKSLILFKSKYANIIRNINISISQSNANERTLARTHQYLHSHIHRHVHTYTHIYIYIYQHTCPLIRIHTDTHKMKSSYILSIFKINH